MLNKLLVIISILVFIGFVFLIGDYLSMVFRINEELKSESWGQTQDIRQLEQLLKACTDELKIYKAK